MELTFNSDCEALDFLEARGYHEWKNGVILSPGHDWESTPDELVAIRYLIEEWDFLGVSDT